jgi:hypothetical protein
MLRWLQLLPAALALLACLHSPLPVAAQTPAACVDNDGQIAALARVYNIPNVTNCATAVCATAVLGCADKTLVGSTVRSMCPMTCSACPAITTAAPTTARLAVCIGACSCIYFFFKYLHLLPLYFVDRSPRVRVSPAETGNTTLPSPADLRLLAHPVCTKVRRLISSFAHGACFWT